MAIHFGNIGLILKDRGDLDEALKHHRDALRIHRELGNKHGTAQDLGNIGVILKDRGDLDEGLKHITSALDIATEAGYKALEKKLTTILDELHMPKS